MKPKYKRLVVYGVENNHKKLKSLLALRDKSISQWFREAEKQAILDLQKET